MDTNKIAIQEFKEGEGLFIRSFFADNDFNMNGWSVTQQAIKRDLSSGLDRRYFGRTAPIIMTDDLSHPPANVTDMITAQEPHRVGDFLRVGVDQNSGRGYVDAVITDKIAIEKIQNGELNFVSPSIRANSEIHLADGKVIVPSFKVNHLAIVGNPAYGVMMAQIKGRCTGTSEECLKQLSNVQASRIQEDGLCLGKFSCGTMILQADYELLPNDIKTKIKNGDTLDRKDLLSLTGDMDPIKEKLTEMPYGSYQADPCVSKWIPELKSAHPDWKMDQVEAVAFSKCGESKKGNKEGEGYFWQKNFGAFDDLKYTPERGFMVGNKFIDVYASVNDYKVPWGSDDHKHLHAMNLPHTHCYAVREADKLITKQRFNSNYKAVNAQAEHIRGNLKEDDTFNYIQHNIGIFSAFANALKPINSNTNSSMSQSDFPEKDNDKNTKGIEEIKKEYEGLKKHQAETDEELKKEKEKRKELEAALQAQLKSPLVEKIIQASIKLGTIKEADRASKLESLGKLELSALQTMQAEYDTLATAKEGITKQSDQYVRFHQAETYQADMNEESKKKSDMLNASILSRCHNQ